MVESARPLHHGLIRSAELHGDRVAVAAPGGELTYRTLRERAAGVAATLQSGQTSDEVALSAVLVERDLGAAVAIAGCLMSGHGYVPLNPAFPVERIANMLGRSGCRALTCDVASLSLLSELLPRCPNVRRVLTVEAKGAELSELAALHSGVEFVGEDQFRAASDWTEPRVDEDSIAYLLFTSGSTGRPKGVMVSQRNIRRFLDVMQERYQLTEQDRLSQMFELVFDLSLFDLFMAWEAGARLCIPTRKDILIPSAYIQRHQLTVWFSVPSTALLMLRLRQLSPDAFPSLRISLFCGEALQCDVVSKWAAAAPNSIVENLYGPTELTLACTLYRWKGAESEAASCNGIVPIGEPYPGMQVLVVDENLREVPPGEIGELLMAGPQVALGYWQDLEKTRNAFVVPPGCERIHYRTGDLVRRPAAQAPLVYLGRVDQQVKIHGHRVELGEIESVLREAASADQAVVIPHPVVDGVIRGLVGFVRTAEMDPASVMPELQARLPSYMVPNVLRALARFPLNSNGKVDRRALTALLTDGDPPDPSPLTPNH